MGVTGVARRTSSQERGDGLGAQRESEPERSFNRFESRARTADLAQPIAARLRAPSWRDPRLLFGILLVAGAVALGSWVMTTGQKTIGVYVTSQAIAPGDRVATEQLSVVQVRGEHVHEHYLLADEKLPAHVVALRVLAPGEFIPRSAVGDAELMQDRPVAIPISTSLSKNVTPGSLADLWFVPDVPVAKNVGTPEGSGSDSGEPRQLAAGLVVAEITENTGLMTSSGLSVHVLVPTDVLPGVIGALAAPGQVSLVPVPGALS